MKTKIIKLTRIQLLLINSLFLTFPPMGLIYYYDRDASIMSSIYIIRIMVHSAIIFFCLYKKKNKDLIDMSIRLFVAWAVLLVFSTYLNSYSLSTTIRALDYSLTILTYFLVIKYMFKYADQKLFSIIYKCFTIFMTTNFLTTFFYPDGLYDNGWQGSMYLFGGKFTTFYVYYTWFCLYCIIRKKTNVWEYIIPISLGLYMCVRTDCSTGIACLGFIGILVLIKKWIVKIKPWIMIAILLSITSLMVLTNVIFDSSIVQYVITNILHRNALMTGRVEIYRSFTQIIDNYKWIGAGYGNTIIIDNTILGYQNAQNGVLDIITKTGILGIIVFLTVLYSFWKDGYVWLKKTDMMENILAAVFVIGFLFVSFAEICFNNYFFILLALMSGNLASVVSKRKRVRILRYS